MSPTIPWVLLCLFTFVVAGSPECEQADEDAHLIQSGSSQILESGHGKRRPLTSLLPALSSTLMRQREPPEEAEQSAENPAEEPEEEVETLDAEHVAMVAPAIRDDGFVHNEEFTPSPEHTYTYPDLGQAKEHAKAAEGQAKSAKAVFEKLKLSMTNFTGPTDGNSFLPGAARPTNAPEEVPKVKKAHKVSDPSLEVSEMLAVLADLSDQVYQLIDGPNITMTEGPAKEAGYSLLHEFPYNSTEGVGVAVFHKQEPSGSMGVVAIAAPTVNNTSLGTTLWEIKPQVAYDKRLAYVATDLRALVGPNRVLVTGHSMGGFYAEILATHMDMPGAVFQAPGPDGQSRGFNGKLIPRNFQVVLADKDAIGNVNYHKKNLVVVKGLKSHDIKDMRAALESKRGNVTQKFTNQNVLELCWTDRNNICWL